MKLLLALSCVIVFWNVENFFDPAADSDNPSELSFTPSGERRWTFGRMRAKARAIAKVVLALADSSGAPPELVGLCEVENSHCLRELVSGTALRKYGYRYIHYDSPDRRGIDCALLYRSIPDDNPSSGLLPAGDSSGEASQKGLSPGAAHHFRRHPLTPSLGRLLASRSVPLRDSTGTIIPTRALLLAEFDSLSVIICHLPSKLGGSSQADARRSLALRTLAHLCDSLLASPLSSIPPSVSDHQKTAEHRRIVVIGDFNDTGTAESDSLMHPMRELLPANPSPGISVPGTTIPSAPGTIKFEGIWEQIDRAFISGPLAPNPTAESISPDNTQKNSIATLHIIALPILTTHDKKFGGTKPRRTYQGPRYLGGVSDHYPIMVFLSPSQ